VSTATEQLNPPPETEARPPRSVWPDFSLLGVALIWGANIPIMKIGLVDVEPFAFNAIRLALSAVVLSILAMRESSPSVKWPAGLWKQIAIYAVIASGMYQILFLLGVYRTATGNGSLIMATMPMWTALLARFLLGERLNGMARIGLTTAFLGTLVVALEKGVSGDRHLLVGNFFMLMAALAWAGGTVQSRKVLPYISPMRLSAISAVSMLPVQFACAATSLTSIGPRLSDPNVWGSMVYAGVLSTGLALPMWSYGVRHSGAAQAAVFQNLVPIVAIASAWFIQHDPVTSNQILGGVLILGGLVLVRRSRG
jgi:drug/metabolite transporter (DMT)-like permease